MATKKTPAPRKGVAKVKPSLQDVLLNRSLTLIVKSGTDTIYVECDEMDIELLQEKCEQAQDTY